RRCRGRIRSRRLPGRARASTRCRRLRVRARGRCRACEPRPSPRGAPTRGTPLSRRLRGSHRAFASARGYPSGRSLTLPPMSLMEWEEPHPVLLRRLGYVLLATFVVDVVGTVLVYMLERHARGTQIHTFGDALFFTTVQLLTVSSQIRNPLTA